MIKTKYAKFCVELMQVSETNLESCSEDCILVLPISISDVGFEGMNGEKEEQSQPRKAFVVSVQKPEFTKLLLSEGLIFLWNPKFRKLQNNTKRLHKLKNYSC